MQLWGWGGNWKSPSDRVALLKIHQASLIILKDNLMKSKASQHKLPFPQRFDIEVGLETAKQRFVNRVLNAIDSEMNGLATKHDYPYRYDKEMIYVANVLGEEAIGANPFKYYTGTDFGRLLLCLEALYAALKKYKSFGSSWEIENLDKIIRWALSVSEVDLNVEWDSGIFKKRGAELFDKDLVREPMKWLADPKYKNVLAPFEKGLNHYLEANKKPEKLADTITDMYEALEAMAKSVTGKARDLSANRELFVSRLRLGRQYGKMLIDYIDYANDYRHGAEPSKAREIPNPNEVEAFIYTTGLFIRLAVKQMEGGG